MSLTSSSSTSSLSTRTRSSWFQAMLLTLTVYVLFFSAVCCHAVPVWQSSSRQPLADDQAEVAAAVAATDDVLSRTNSADFGSADLILRLCSAGRHAESSVFVRTLCNLAMVDARDAERTRNHEGFVKRGVSPDRSSFGAFNQLVHRLVAHANEVAEYQRELNRFKQLGLVDNDYNVIVVPHDLKERMKTIG
ncbi:uncharacterized protein [Diadema antillarum]|uniref:uncharacterized protein n=1 Tax=Diadema antillarum TaxID=105358 RepID=UPI003A85BDD2